MLKLIYSILLMLSSLYADQSPILGYERSITKEGKIDYVKEEGNFTLNIIKLIDTHNIYHKGTVDNYDDPYIESIMKSQEVFKYKEGKSKKHIFIAFKDKANRENFLKEFGLGIFEEQNLSISLVQMDANKITFPMNLKVYPLFVMGSRYVQGVINKQILKGLISESNYATKKKKLDLEILYEELSKKFDRTKANTKINYNTQKELFEVSEINETKTHSYISKEGRYILVL